MGFLPLYTVKEGSNYAKNGESIYTKMFWEILNSYQKHIIEALCGLESGHWWNSTVWPQLASFWEYQSPLSPSLSPFFLFF